MITVGVVLYIMAMFVSPRLYQEPDISRRANIIEENRFRWNISQVMFALGMGAPALGFLLLTLHLQDIHRNWTIYAGAASFIAGALLGAIFVYRETFDPVQYWESAHPSALIVGAAALWSCISSRRLSQLVRLCGSRRRSRLAGRVFVDEGHNRLLCGIRIVPHYAGYGGCSSILIFLRVAVRINRTTAL